MTLETGGASLALPLLDYLYLPAVVGIVLGAFVGRSDGRRMEPRGESWFFEVALLGALAGWLGGGNPPADGLLAQTIAELYVGFLTGVPFGIARCESRRRLTLWLRRQAKATPLRRSRVTYFLELMSPREWTRGRLERSGNVKAEHTVVTRVHIARAITGL